MPKKAEGGQFLEMRRGFEEVRVKVEKSVGVEGGEEWNYECGRGRWGGHCWGTS